MIRGLNGVPIFLALGFSSMMVLGVPQGFEPERLPWQWLYQHIPYTWTPARPGTSQAWPPASPHSHARSWLLGQGLGKVFFCVGGSGGIVACL